MKENWEEGGGGERGGEGERERGGGRERERGGGREEGER